MIRIIVGFTILAIFIITYVIIIIFFYKNNLDDLEYFMQWVALQVKVLPHKA